MKESAIDFPGTDDPVWILGRQYSALHQLQDIRTDIRSKIWLTYRKGFQPIGGTGPTDDKGWGCMLRCGQMVLAQALITKHLGRDWTWKEQQDQLKDSTIEERRSFELYLRILSLFQDNKSSPYSIHQIASMGATEGKPIGNWFGPNTIAQVLK